MLRWSYSYVDAALQLRVKLLRSSTFTLPVHRELRIVTPQPIEVRMFSALQLKAARSLAGWSREELAERSGVAAETIKRFELRGSDPKVSTLLKLRRALASVGIEFTDAADGRGEGVRFKTDSGAAPLAKKRTPASTKLPRSK